MRTAVKRHVLRGHLQVQVRIDSAALSAPAGVNSGLLDTYLTVFRRMSAIHGLHGEPDLNAALSIPGMFQETEETPDPGLETVLVGVLEDALAQLNEFREREGAEIAAEMRARVATVLRGATEMEQIRLRAVPHFQARLSERVGELLKDAVLDPQRLAQEIAYLVERSDITEELTRLKVHAVELHDLLDSGGEIGKKIDFLLQEMHRETNTILSKSTAVGESGLEITDLALMIKSEIEKIREQGLNLE